jgi:hypothetical protein
MLEMQMKSLYVYRYAIEANMNLVFTVSWDQIYSNITHGIYNEGLIMNILITISRLI